MKTDNFSIFELTVKATASAMELFGSRSLSSSIDSMILFYRKEWHIIEDMINADAPQGGYDAEQFAMQKSLMSDQRLNRIAVP